MDSKILFLLFGIITFVVAKPKSDESPLLITNENDLQQLLKTLYNDGKFDIAFSHHEDSPESHHQDITRITQHDKRSHHRHLNEDMDDHRHTKTSKSHTHSDEEEIPNISNIENLNLFLRKKLKNNHDNYDSDDAIDLIPLRSEDNHRSDSNVDRVVDLLNALENNEDSENRCGGQRCGKGRSEDRDDDDSLRSSKNSDNLLCLGDDCSRDEVYVEDRASCVGDKCGRKDDDENFGYDRDDDDDGKNVERCNGDSCSFDRKLLRERRLPDGDAEIARLFQSKATKIKVNDNLDALVLDLSDVEKYLGNSQAKKQDENERNEIQIFRDVDISDLIEVNRDGDEKTIRDQNALESNGIKAVVVDLSKTENDLTNQINDLMRNIQTPSKQHKHKVLNKKHNIQSRGESKIMAHDEDNNHVYVPRWLLDEIVTKTNLRAAKKPKNLFPLTLKQKEKLAKAKAKALKQNQAAQRIFRRSINDDIGVPFHLQIEGLGQVES